MPVRTSVGHLPDQLRWDGVLLLAKAVPQLWPELAEEIHEYIRNIGRLHLRKPNPGAPGADRVVIEVDGTEAELAPSGDDVQERWIVVASLDELRVARLNGKRLLALWNGLPGVERLGKVGDRAALVDRLWSALEALPDPQPVRPSKQAEVIALLRRPEGATVDEVRAATGWQPHTVRGVFSGALKKKLGLAVVATQEERGRVYRIAEAGR